MRTADEGAGRAVGLGGHAAGVDHHHIGFGGLAFGQARSAQTIGDRFAIGARGAAAEVFDVEGDGHESSLAEFEELAAVSRPVAS